MSQVRAAFRSGVVRVVAAALLLLGLFTVTPMLSGAASAHTAHLEASVQCDGTVEWTATSWSKDDKGRNDDVRVRRDTDGGHDGEVGHGSFTKSNGYTFSGHFTWPAGATSMTVSTHPQGSWGSGDDADNEEGHDEVQLEQPDCDEQPHVEHELKCDDSAPGYGDGDVTVTLTNPAGPFGRDAEFDVYEPDQHDHHQRYTVKAGEHHDVEFHGLDEGHHHIEVSEGGDDHSRDVEVNCDQAVPSVTVSKVCLDGDGAVTVNLFNTGGETAVFSVEDPTTHAVEDVEVAPNESASRTFAGLADGEVTVHVTSGELDLSQHVEVHCDQVVEPPHPECEADHGSSTTAPESSAPESSAPESSAPETSGYSSSSYGGGEVTTTTTMESDDDEESSGTTSTTVKGDDETDDNETDDHENDDDPCNPPAEHPQPKVEVAKACVANDGEVTITLTAVAPAGEEADSDESLTFVVNGEPHEVPSGQSVQVVLSGLTDGTHHVSVTVGDQDLSFDVDIACDLSPRITVTQECSAFDGQVTFLLENLGDDTDATFTVNGVDHVVAPGASATVVIGGLADGEHQIPLAVNGTPLPDATVTVQCNPVLDAVAQCNTVSNLGEVQTYWFTITNTEATDLEISWDGGSTVLAAGATVTVGSTTAPLSVRHGDEVVTTADATDVVCSRDIVVDKELIGAPAEPETYTVTVSRLVDGQFVPEVSVPVRAGTPVTITLPSTLDPAGIQYRVDETDKGSASSSAVTPGELTLVGHLGDAIHVTVTNSYTGTTTSTSTPNGSTTTSSIPDGSTTTSSSTTSSSTTSSSTTTSNPNDSTTTIISVEPPVPPVTTTPGGLPRTGGGSTYPMMLFAFGLACIGGAMALARRKA